MFVNTWVAQLLAEIGLLVLDWHTKDLVIRGVRVEWRETAAVPERFLVVEMWRYLLVTWKKVFSQKST